MLLGPNGCLQTNTLTQLEEEILNKQEKMEELSESLRTLDREHDTLRRQCDDKDEEISKLRNQLQNKVKNNTLYTVNFGRKYLIHYIYFYYNRLVRMNIMKVTSLV